MTDIVNRLIKARDMLLSGESAHIDLPLSETITEIKNLRDERDALLNALIDVVKVADRATDEFDAARTAIDAVRKIKTPLVQAQENHNAVRRKA